MPWQNQKRTSPKYQTREYREARKRFMAELVRNGSGRCAEPICVMRSRLILPSMRLHLSHNDAGTVLLGMSHKSCNESAAARKARRIQSKPLRRSNVW